MVIALMLPRYPSERALRMGRSPPPHWSRHCSGNKRVYSPAEAATCSIKSWRT